MTSLHVICGLAPPQSKILAMPMQQCAMCIPDTGGCIFVLIRASSRVVAYNFAKIQDIRCIASSLKVLWYGNLEWKKNLVWNGIWNGRFLVWSGNGTEENCLYGMCKNHLPFHSILRPARQCKPSTQSNTLSLASDSAIRLHLLQNSACVQHYDDSRFFILVQDRSPFHLSTLEAT